MRVFFDTEFFEDGKTIDLMSIGMVRDDGAELYIVNTECDWRRPFADKWHQANTLLGCADAVRFETRAEIAASVIAFVGESPEFWAYYADYDWVALCQLYGRMIDLPSGWPMYCRDFKQLAESIGWTPSKNDGHHALGDALWLKHKFDRYVKLTNGGGL